MNSDTRNITPVKIINFGDHKTNIDNNINYGYFALTTGSKMKQPNGSDKCATEITQTKMIPFRCLVEWLSIKPKVHKGEKYDTSRFPRS